jgi:glucosamine-6-phosphate deaminase
MEVVMQPSAAAAVEFVVEIIAAELRTNPAAVLGLATGRTMEPVYAQLVQLRRQTGLSFAACRTFNLDEYLGLASTDARSFRDYMNQHLFSQVDIAPGNTHVPNGCAQNPEAECASYERSIAAAGGIDLQLLGIGLTGHVGFNEPKTDFASRTRVTVLAPETLEQNADSFGGAHQVPHLAVTMGIGTILDCRRCILLATGSAKAEIIAKAIEGPVTSDVPASALQLHPNFIVVLDQSAGSKLKETSSLQSAAS